MESDLRHHHYFLHDQPQLHHQNQMNSGLMRYQSAPSTYFSSFLDKEAREDFLSRPTSPETERILSRFLANSGDTSSNISNQNLGAIKEESPVKEVEAPQQVNRQAQIMALINDKNDTTKLHQQQQQGNYSYASQRFYQSQSKPPLPGHGSGSGRGYRAATRTGVEQLPQMKVGGASNSNLVRHSSSPAGLFANISIEFENGYAALTGLGEYGGTNREASYPVASRPPPSSEQNSVVAEIGNQNMGENNPDSSNYVPSFPIRPWDDSALMPAGAKGLSEGDRSLSGGLNALLETQDGKAGRPPLVLAHHLSLPKTSAEMSAIEKLLQDSVPCKIRAKRGCATHPRSIAERVRRTRISERMRKLQDLVPNMDNQTSTADMLDLAVDYIKDLQRQVKTLSETRARCTCTGGAAQKAEV